MRRGGGCFCSAAKELHEGLSITLHSSPTLMVPPLLSFSSTPSPPLLLVFSAATTSRRGARWRRRPPGRGRRPLSPPPAAVTSDTSSSLFPSFSHPPAAQTPLLSSTVLAKVTASSLLHAGAAKEHCRRLLQADAAQKHRYRLTHAGAHLYRLSRQLLVASSSAEEAAAELSLFSSPPLSFGIRRCIQQLPSQLATKTHLVIVSRQEGSSSLFNAAAGACSHHALQPGTFSILMRISLLYVLVCYLYIRWICLEHRGTRDRGDSIASCR
ncbi:uncharacterized protein LOC121984787 [Zingiber officinale]|uniref:uncharacterized protein LOC121984787 n=1 Tax=Zingiber officinale TaxID=94328 RepID=UPI001C4AB09B|nr:uncharacterized protein LOC121984787 [Zingiber officinale]